MIRKFWEQFDDTDICFEIDIEDGLINPKISAITHHGYNIIDFLDKIIEDRFNLIKDNISKEKRVKESIIKFIEVNNLKNDIILINKIVKELFVGELNEQNL